MVLFYKTINHTAVLYCCVFLLPFILSCSKEEPDVNASISNFGFPEKVYNNEKNPLSAEKIQLGRFLFYDPILSKDSTIHCGSCHTPEHAFADHNVSLSKGVDGTLGVRNTPAIFNLAWYKSFNWDGGVNHIEIQPVGPITNELEMKETLANVLHKLNTHRKYPQLFKEAFGVDKIEDKELLLALTQFQQSIVSDNSKFDQYIKGETTFSDSEKLGMDLFDKNCSSCHTGMLLTNFEFKDNGLTIKKESEPGRSLISQNPEDKWKFRVPSLRNVALTYPYMHTGEIPSLVEVIEMYSNGTGTSNDENLPKGGFQFSQEEKDALLNFLKTLNDYEFISNPDYGPNTFLLDEI